MELGHRPVAHGVSRIPRGCPRIAHGFLRVRHGGVPATKPDETVVRPAISEAQSIEPERVSRLPVRRFQEQGTHGFEPVHAPLESVVAPLEPVRKSVIPVRKSVIPERKSVIPVRESVFPDLHPPPRALLPQPFLRHDSATIAP